MLCLEAINSKSDASPLPPERGLEELARVPAPSGAPGQRGTAARTHFRFSSSVLAAPLNLTSEHLLCQIRVSLVYAAGMERQAVSSDISHHAKRQTLRIAKSILGNAPLPNPT